MQGESTVIYIFSLYSCNNWARDYYTQLIGGEIEEQES